jgi:hypothetical protein
MLCLFHIYKYFRSAAAVIYLHFVCRIQSYDLNAWKQQQAKLKAQDGTYLRGQGHF